MNHAYMGGNTNSNNVTTKPLQSNRYMQNSNITYQNIPSTKRLPYTIFPHYQQHPSPHNKPYLQRNQSFYNRQYNYYLIQLIAKIRSLYDDLLNYRFKNYSLYRKILYHERVIDNLYFYLNKQSYQLQKYVHEIELSNYKNFEILKYEKNLYIVGEEIQQLNDILVRRNHYYDLACAENRELVSEINKMIYEGNLMNVRVGMWTREVDALVEYHKTYMVYRGIINKPSGSNGGHGKVNSNKSFSNTNRILTTPSPQRYPNYLSPTHINYQSFLPNNNDSITFKQQNYSGYYYLSFDQNNNPTIYMGKKLYQLKSLCTSLSSYIHTNTSSYYKMKMQLYYSLMSEKYKYIKLYYEHKLLYERIKDSDKKKDLIEKHYQDMRLYQQLNYMIKNYDDYLYKIYQLKQYNYQLKYELYSLQQAQYYIYQVNGQYREGIVKSMYRYKYLLEYTINELTAQIAYLKYRLKEMEQYCYLLLGEKYQLTLEHNEQYAKSAKKIRKLYYDNYQYQIRIEQITGEMNLLKRELTIINQQYYNQYDYYFDT